MSRVTASILFHTQVVLLYLHNLGESSLLKCALQPEIAKN